jgi:hypothetical protein
MDFRVRRKPGAHRNRLGRRRRRARDAAAPARGGLTRSIPTALMRTLQISTPADCTHPDSWLSSDFDDFKRRTGTRLAT